MAIKDRGCRALTSPFKRRRTCVQSAIPSLRRHAATATAVSTISPDQDIRSTGFSRETPVDKSYDPLAMSRARKTELPPSRYQYRPPKYDRGPLHPHQPPPASDPSSRLFVPGPFTSPRLQETYNSTIAPDLMTLSYQHFAPHITPREKPQRLRSWEGSSPYFKNRPLRGPRGGDTLSLLRKRVLWHNIPQLEGVVVHTFVKEALESSGPFHVASMAVQAITGAKPYAHAAKHNEVKWGLRAGKMASLSATLRGEEMYHFLSRLIDVVCPRIRDWKGVKGSSGDGSGNITFGLAPECVALFPEIEINYDAYPPKLIPGCHVTIQTSATTDRDARLLLTAVGLPFYGKRAN